MASQPIERISEVAEDLHEKGFHLELQAAFLQRKSGDIAGAIDAINQGGGRRGHMMRGDDPLWLAVLSFQLQQSLLAAHRKYNQSLRLAQATVKSRFRWVTSRPIKEIAMAIGTLAGLLDSCGFHDAGRQYQRSAFGLLKFSAAIATENQSMDELFDAVMHARAIDRDTDGEIFKWVRSIIEQWPEDSPYRKRGEELMDRAVARKKGVKFEGDIETTPRQIHNNILTSAGINPTTEPWAIRCWTDSHWRGESENHRLRSAQACVGRTGT